ncbi:fructose-bisphosphatase class II [Spiroplasma platyhelix]|uniref:Fructose-1,6-bisphosphatase n=1 Tax=Spiroplasma platyhelix PALS-1 TaxID=1276218 RepID=A0A846TZL6_9MOLU|nr:fructose-bisphosphatase class II [Spiroplasma platyhelix]MBE4703841.1 Fructose-1,6-bisphosphatase 1 class 2 [Spiroplasma platyhelix PALS-1]NKE38214.1 fructose-bisphosphatase class II family protein [Spiroplasma platyhelix PALS-1]UJB29099.1 fructose 1,6-bisphosphatase II [Spiroplasma platyhelix PALS-1]
MNKDMHLIRAIEMAAIAAYKYIGTKNKNAVDDAAVQALETILKVAPIKTKVVIGEGELDQAPMLYVGQELGTAPNVTFEIAVDPIEGTYPAAYNIAGSIACLAAAKPGTMVYLPEMYMDKLFVNQELAHVIDLEKGLAWNVEQMQKAKSYHDLIAIVLDKPRNQAAINLLREYGVIVRLIGDGDVLAAIDVINQEADFVYGIGGAPEGVLMAALAISSCGNMHARLLPYQDIWPNEPETPTRMRIEAEQLLKCGLKNYQYLTSEELINDEAVRFIATGLTAGGSLKPIKYQHGIYHLNTFFASHGILRNMQVKYSIEQIKKLRPEIKTVIDKYQRSYEKKNPKNDI